MSMVQLALRRPYTFIVMAMLVVLATPFALKNMATDIFPEINIPVISVIWNYNGLPAQEMGQRVAGQTERGLTTVVSDIEHIESTSLAGVSIIKVFFQPGVNIQTAIAQVVASVQTQVRQLPPGITPPLVIKYSASSIPVMQLALSSATLPENALFDTAVNGLRPQLITVPGVASPFPYGGKVRVISVDLDTQALQARGLSPADVVNAVNTQNLILPSGTVKFGETEYTVRMNGSPDALAGLNDLPVRTANNVTTYLRDVAYVRDGFQPQTNVVRQDGARGVLVSVLKNGGASTLDIVANVRALLPRVVQTLPSDVKVTPLFDQSVFVKAAVVGVIIEALIAAALTALMVLLFLGNWRSTLIIALTIPLSILASILVLFALGETLNLMTLGGLALSVGILVDQAIVTIENIERHLHMGKPLNDAIEVGAGEIGPAGFRRHAVHLYRLRAHVFPLWRGALPVRAAGRGRGVRDDRVLHPVAHAGTDAGDAAHGRRARGGAGQYKTWPAAAPLPQLRFAIRARAPGLHAGAVRGVVAPQAFRTAVPGLLPAVLPAVPLPGPRLFPECGRGPDTPAHARAHRYPHRGNRAHRRRGGNRHPRDDPGRPA
jgi:multidrug efflux pump subunit AcrB